MRWPITRRPAQWLAGVTLVLVCVAALALQWPDNQRPKMGAASASQLDTLHELCVQDMVANTCKVMGTGSVSSAAEPGALVFVAGVGAIDAADYQQMYAAGDAMCSVIRDACSKDWGSNRCLTARALFLKN